MKTERMEERLTLRESERDCVCTYMYSYMCERDRQGGGRKERENGGKTREERGFNGREKIERERKNTFSIM